jgi:RecB family exonuclease
VITPRQTRLVRVPDLHAFRRTIPALRAQGPVGTSRAIVVPTRAAAQVMRRFIQGPAPGPGMVVTRDQLYDDLHARLPQPPPRLSAFERDAIAQAAAHRAAQAAPAGAALSFQLRPGLVGEMLRFYDQLRRQSQQVKRFEELIAGALGGSSADRGAERLLAQTRFLAAAFREYERAAAETGACDEHALRHRLTNEPSRDPLRHIVVTVADWIADPDGLYVADFDLLSRLPGLDALDIICTEAVLGSGFHERIHSWLPGLQEVDSAGLVGHVPSVRPRLITPSTDPEAPFWFTYRDREEELVAVAKRAQEFAPGPRGVVFKHPLPYLYLAPGTLGAAGIPYSTFDALPLAADPTAAVFDAVLDVVETNFTRSAVVALLRTPHLRFAQEGQEISRASISALDRDLSSARYLGDPGRLEEYVERVSTEARPAADAALAATRDLTALQESAPASVQIRRFATFVASHFRELSDDDPFAARERRARAAMIDLLERLADAHAAFHDPPWLIADLAAAFRRWVEGETFLPDSASPGVNGVSSGDSVCLVDDQAARYGEFDEITLVGLIENEWPERPHRNIFYGAALLKALGWPSEKDRRGAADARLLDLVASASARVVLSTFTLDDETLVTRSVQLDEIPRTRLSSLVVEDAETRGPADDCDPGGDRGPERATLQDGWAEMRASRTPDTEGVFHGRIGPRPQRAWSVSALETYIGCPFRFFARHVLRLEEEPDDEEVMDPRRQGQFVHDVFENFFKEWQASGRRTITPENIQEARQAFAGVVEQALTRLPDGEAGLERTRLLGSPAAAGLGEAVFRMEAERPVAVVERLLEHRLEGPVEITTDTGTRVVQLKGKADRLDLLEDGTFRLIDYKLGWPPQKGRALQLPIYGLSAEQRLAGRAGRNWTLGEAAYLAFKGPRRVVPLFSSPAEREEVLAKAQQRLADTLDAIDRGEFPPSPDDVFRCETCSYAPVCRTDYV